MARGSYNHTASAISIGGSPAASISPLILCYPAGYCPTMSRTILHETIHFWQYLSSGYLASIVEEDWLRLKQFKQNGKIAPAGPKRTAFIAKSPNLGFSPKDLHEALARFWDIHIIGPPLLIELELADPQRRLPEAFEQEYRTAEKAGAVRHPETGGYSSYSYRLAMQYAAGNYGKPYLWLMERMSPTAVDILFPLAGYFAFQTPDPLNVFIAIVQRAKGLFESLGQNQVIHLLWRNYFHEVNKIGYQIAYEMGFPEPNHIGHAVLEGGLVDHPVWYCLFQLRRIAGHKFESLPLFFDFPGIPKEKLTEAHGTINLEYALACPGDPDYRGMLVECLSPAYLYFEDGTLWNMAAFVAEIAKDRMLFDAQCDLGHQIKYQHEQWEQFLGARYAS